MVARSLRPYTAYDLAMALEAKGETEQAIALFQDLARLRPTAGWNLFALSKVLKSRGRGQEAEAALEAANAVHRAEIRRKPDSVAAHINLGNALLEQGTLDEAIAEVRLRRSGSRPDRALPTPTTLATPCTAREG